MSAPAPYPLHPPMHVGHRWRLLSIKHELTLHLVVYTTLVWVQVALHHNELQSVFICYVVLAAFSLILGCLASRLSANFLLIPLLLVVIADMFRYLVCAVSMTVGTRSYFFENCKIWFLSNHEIPENYAWAATYAVIFLYLYWTAATLNKIIGRGNYHALQPPGQQAPLAAQYPLVLPPCTPEVSRNMDSPPKYGKLLTKLETPPPRYGQLQLV